MFGLSTLKLGLIGLLISGLGMASAGLYGLATGKRQERQVWEARVEKMRATAAEAALKASTAYRAIESELARVKQEAESALNQERIKNARIAADLARARTERDGLRDQIAAFAAGRGTTDDSLPACLVRAQALGVLLNKALQSGEGSAGDGESCEADKRALLRAWPVTPASQ